jgi:hypothetical protein
MRTVTGVFDNPDVALRAAEKVREVAGFRATVRVHLPGSDGSVVETALLPDESSWGPVPFLGFALGLVGAVVVKLLGGTWAQALLGLMTGAVMGGLLAWWLTGELYPHRIYHHGFAGRPHYDREINLGRSVVTAIVRGTHEAHAVAATLREMGGRTSAGFLHEARMTTRAPLTT